jgi:hypothetical protein
LRPARTRSAICLLLTLIILASAALAHAQPPAPLAGTTLYLPLVAKAGQPDPAPEPDPPPAPDGPTSDELIAQALERGEIGAEAALTYRVFASFGDQRLPERFRGSDAGDIDDLPLELGEQWAQLSPQAQATLRPFTLPPYHAGSWWDLRRQPGRAGSAAPAETRTCDDLGTVDEPFYRDWQYLDAPGGHTRIWWQTRYPEDAAKAKALNAEIDTIWGHLAALMKREPPHDGGDLRPCRGGDNRLDISLVDFEHNGQVWRSDHGSPMSGPTSSFMLLNRSRESNAAMRATLIHELMHMFQFAFHMRSGWEYLWWMEATATWAQHYVETLEPAWRTDSEHIRAWSYLQHPDLALETRTLGSHQYGAYLLPYFMDLTNNSGADLVRQSFERSETMDNSLENIDGLVPGGFKEQWPKFTLRNVNYAPVNDYEKDDGLKFRVSFASDRAVALEGAGDRTYALDGEVGHLASHVFRFRFPFASADLRSLLFVNPFASGNWPTAGVKALVKIGGQWKEEDWTQHHGRVYCRDLKAERVEELMIVISNSEWKDRSHVLKPAYPPRLNVTNVACRGWKFEGTAHMDYADEFGQLDETTRVSGTFLRLRQAGDDGGARTMEMYQMSGGQGSWTHTGSDILCAGSGSGSFTPTGGSHATLLLRPFATDTIAVDYEAGNRRYHGFGSEGPGVFLAQHVTYICADGTMPEVNIATVAHWFLTETVPTQQVSADGKTIKGAFTFTEEGDSFRPVVIEYAWEMTALPPE